MSIFSKFSGYDIEIVSSAQFEGLACKLDLKAGGSVPEVVSGAVHITGVALGGLGLVDELVAGANRDLRLRGALGANII